uniref:Small ribosomal subunit protein uS8c n=1 Tax=Pseudocodium devriesii TaxID=453070 RepID=A0A386B127_9CHLO|nr:ribosomal protein S8 [Pseudocodium devriesii]AYC65399.1 ribosomal protein S8 [Pseudocodium devriesii]
MINDSISDFFSRIRNANLVRRQTVEVPCTKTNESLSQILLRNGFLQNYRQNQSTKFLVLTLKYERTERSYNKPIIVQIQRLSRPGCRFYVPAHKIPQICGQLGVVFLSTSKGILSDREASSLKVGGEILGFVT